MTDDTNTQTTPAPDTTFDPGEHTVDEVAEHLRALDAERDRVLEAEKAGQDRVGVAKLAPKAAAEQPAVPTAAAAMPASLSCKLVVAAVNADDPDDADPETVKGLQAALYRFGAQDPSYELPRSWQRVQRRIHLEDGEQTDGIATPDQVKKFADKVGIELTK
jgi:hypothetical protein